MAIYLTKADAADLARATSLTGEALSKWLDTRTEGQLDYLQLNLLTSWVEEARKTWRRPDAS